MIHQVTTLICSLLEYKPSQIVMVLPPPVARDGHQNDDSWFIYNSFAMYLLKFDGLVIEETLMTVIDTSRIFVNIDGSIDHRKYERYLDVCVSFLSVLIMVVIGNYHRLC